MTYLYLLCFFYIPSWSGVIEQLNMFAESGNPPDDVIRSL